jgi:hypothetical protein
MEYIKYVYLIAALVILLLIFWHKIMWVKWRLSEFFAKIEFMWRYRKYPEFRKKVHSDNKIWMDIIGKKIKSKKDSLNKRGLWS